LFKHIWFLIFLQWSDWLVSEAHFSLVLCYFSAVVSLLGWAEGVEDSTGRGRQKYG